MGFGVWGLGLGRTPALKSWLRFRVGSSAQGLRAWAYGSEQDCNGKNNDSEESTGTEKGPGLWERIRSVMRKSESLPKTIFIIPVLWCNMPPSVSAII